MKIENPVYGNDSTLLTLRNVNLVDVKKGIIKTNQEIVMKAGKIVKVRKTSSKAGQGKVLNLDGAFVMPGLIDGHVHVTAPFKNNIENTYKQLNYFVSHGITSVRDAGGNGAALLEARNEITKGNRIGPDVYFAAFMAGDWYYNRGANIRKEPFTPWEQRLVPGDNLDEAMASAKACGATGVKLYHSFDKDFLKDIVQAAKRHGLKVWGHTMMYPAKPVDVVKAGVEVLSHVYMLEALRKKEDTIFRRRSTSNAYRDSAIASIDITEFCKEMKAHHAIMDATLCVSVEKDPWSLPLLKRVHGLGVEISAGTDQIVELNRPYPHLIDELMYYTKDCGFTNAEALRSATISASKVIGQEKNIGLIEKGRQADLIVLKENPLLNIEALKNIDLVIKSGRMINQ
ncbi:amidohydrolase family protein [Pedobacter sp. N23S346]|uniref:amidohydrolase family protein n=1 Tax=Pedobacter sp. N23S346 TaxID=3402750 RepID=UPI003AC0A3F3